MYFCDDLEEQGCISGGTNIELIPDSFLVAVFSCYYYTVVETYIPAARTAEWMIY